MLLSVSLWHVPLAYEGGGRVPRGEKPRGPRSADVALVQGASEQSFSNSVGKDWVEGALFFVLFGFVVKNVNHKSKLSKL